MNRPYSHHKRAADWSFKEDYPRVDSALSNLGLRNPVDLVTPLGVLLGGAGGYGLYRLWLKNIADPKKTDGFWTKNVPLASFLASGALIGGRLGHDAETEIQRLID